MGMSAFDIEVPDTELAAAQRGEARAQASLYRRFERPAYTLARRMVTDPDGAADVLQDAFVTAFRSLHQFRGEAPFGHWLRRVVATAVQAAPGQAGTALEVTRALRARLSRDLPEVPRLARGFCPALGGKAMIDALCRGLELPFWQAAQATT
mgnify:CR=1 FL=1